MGTTPRGYTYPDAGDHTRLWEHFQELATDLDTDVGNLAPAFGTTAARPAAGSAPGRLYVATDTRRIWQWDSSHWQLVSGPTIPIWDLIDTTSTLAALGPGGASNIVAAAGYTIPANERARVRGRMAAWVRLGEASGSVAGSLLFRLGGVELARVRLHSGVASGPNTYAVSAYGEASVTGGSSLTPNVRLEVDSGSSGNIQYRNVHVSMYY